MAERCGRYLSFSDIPSESVLFTKFYFLDLLAIYNNFYRIWMYFIAFTQFYITTNTLFKKCSYKKFGHINRFITGVFR